MLFYAKHAGTRLVQVDVVLPDRPNARIVLFMFLIGNAKDVDRRNEFDACFCFGDDFLWAREDLRPNASRLDVQVLLRQGVFSRSYQLFNPRVHLAEACLSSARPKLNDGFFIFNVFQWLCKRWCVLHTPHTTVLLTCRGIRPL